MEKINDKELEQINGGFSWSVAAVVGAAVTFVIGVIAGYFNPIKCNN